MSWRTIEHQMVEFAKTRPLTIVASAAALAMGISVFPTINAYKLELIKEQMALMSKELKTELVVAQHERVVAQHERVLAQRRIQEEISVVQRDIQVLKEILLNKND